ncbi:FAD-binding oxidoreductase [Tianweitania sp. BSSL-BM11]|uniref:FAD-binding oxidoreductase n=1 Tax=Tianweitania aestuarii TaxID=2814886 RepID=A0ABS5RUV3_9HYPH|nr:FAD-binding oxidoreductase [Tianweitania aestuarii]MBS9720833.1 FAD-binding oxidoreductase [Tianweitania aestuarii]
MNGPLRSFGQPAGSGRSGISPADGIARLNAGALANGSLLGFGNGRSYGDSCLNDLGTLIDMRALNRIIRFDAASGLIEVEAGVMLSDIIAYAAGQGWFPPVVPGTQFVSVGGAIANDIHGKNHHRAGTFGCHVESFVLLRSDGEVRHCSSTTNADLFAATIGGMGLTGLILSATIRLMRVPSLAIDQTATPFRDLNTFFDLAPEADRTNAYAVAWIDQLASGDRAGCGVLLAGNHADDGDFQAAKPGRLRVPFQPPISLLNRPFIHAFNAAYGWKQGRKQQSRVGYQSYFFPLDGVRDWNRLYGPRGLLQHQSVVSEEAAREAVPALLAAGRNAGHASFLTVLKRFGDRPSPGLLSFPRSGYTLTLDFPDAGAATRHLFERLDAIAIDAGGAVNPYKDARMSPAVFARSFPNWRELEALRDSAFLSNFWRRTALALEPSTIHAV